MCANSVPFSPHTLTKEEEEEDLEEFVEDLGLKYHRMKAANEWFMKVQSGLVNRDLFNSRATGCSTAVSLFSQDLNYPNRVYLDYRGSVDREFESYWTRSRDNCLENMRSGRLLAMDEGGALTTVDAWAGGDGGEGDRGHKWTLLWNGALFNKRFRRLVNIPQVEQVHTFNFPPLKEYSQTL